jgi:hypothetical protein
MVLSLLQLFRQAGYMLDLFKGIFTSSGNGRMWLQRKRSDRLDPDEGMHQQFP